MFDIGFWELGLIMVVALLVIGPERMPAVARKAGILIGKGQKFIRSVKDDINQELAADELKRALKEHSDAAGLHEIIEETKGSIEEIREDYILKSINDKPAETGSKIDDSTNTDTDNKSLPDNVPEKQQ